MGFWTTMIPQSRYLARPRNCVSLSLAAVILSVGSCIDSARSQSLELYFHAQGDSAQSYLGGRLTGIGDVNHDGYDDIAIGAGGDRKTYIYYGNDIRDSLPDFFLPVAGVVLEGLSDINGDLYPDLAAGNDSVIFIYYGNPTTLNLIPGDTVRPPYGSPAVGLPHFGAGFAAADFDGDGVVDFAVVDQGPAWPRKPAPK